MPRHKKESDEYSGLRKDLSMTVEKLIAERIGNLQDSVLLGNRLFTKPGFVGDEVPSLENNITPSIQARTIVDKSDFEVGESFNQRIQVKNIGTTWVSIARIDAAVPLDFESYTSPNSYKIVNTFLDLQGKRLDPYASENIDMALIPTRRGAFLLAPRIIYTTSVGLERSCKPDPISISVSETTMPNRIKTGFQDLDNLLFGGLPRNFAVILTSISCDERDLLVKRFLETGAREGNTTLCVIVDPEDVRNLVYEFKHNFYVLTCSPRLDENFEKLPNVAKATGVENLTEINIALETLLRNLSEEPHEKGDKRACLEVLSDVLLEHGAVQTRKWLSRLIPELRSRGFTTLAVVNPHMHTSEQLQAVLDLFDGEISIYEKADDDITKYLRIRKMHRQRYLENELPVRKTRLMTTPLTLSCCSRASTV
jgi:KaiC/GvpD/RAD55 family RecA-like ATPase